MPHATAPLLKPVSGRRLPGTAAVTADVFSTGPVNHHALAAIHSQGHVRLKVSGIHGETRLSSCRQEGCLRLRFPRVENGLRREAVLLNTAGGLTGSDVLTQYFCLDASASMTMTSQAAEKIYRSLGPPARITTLMHLMDQADAEWLPQETILFDGSHLDRRLDVSMAANARFLALEATVFGRTAMQETVETGKLVDRWTIRRAGRLIYADTLRLDGAPAAMLDKPAVAQGARAIATLILVDPHANALLADVRQALQNPAVFAAASSWNGVLLARILAPDGEVLRKTLLPALASLREGRALPRVWSC